MKQFIIVLTSVLLLVLCHCSCTKAPLPEVQNSVKTIRFSLYTKDDFSGDNHNIIFSLFVRTHTKVIFDSTLSVMKIKDSPDSTHQLHFEKLIMTDSGSDLAAGFRYTIENVGTASFIDSVSAADTFKIIHFIFK